MTIETFAARIGIAVLAGAVIGIEREWKNKDAGFRTNILVTIGAAVFVTISEQVAESHDGDITRIIGQVVSGIGFLGAGVILRDGGQVRGLTTAATIWCCAAVGSLCGIGYFMQAILVTIGILIINFVVGWVEHKLTGTVLPENDQERSREKKD